MKDTLTPIAEAARETRRRLHRRPELSGAEHATRDVLIAELEALGFKPETFEGNAGVSVLWPGQDNSSCLMLRADMDALPLKEESGVPWASEHDGIMHACGHDGHMAVLLGVARWLAETRPVTPKATRLLFQPAEETGRGAPELIASGILETPRVEAAFALHGWPELPVGTLAVPDRAVMAAVDNFTITIRGKGGHGAMPHLARDPVPAAAALITTAQTLVSRRAAPLDPVVLTFGHVSAGKAHNVIPETCVLRGTLRTLDPVLRTELTGALEALSRSTAEAHGVTAEIEWIEACPATINNPDMAKLAREGIAAALGADVLRDRAPSMGGEDFSYFLEKVPGAYFWLGLGMDRGSLHNPRFDFNDEAIATGIAAFTGIVERWFRKSGQ